MSVVSDVSYSMDNDHAERVSPIVYLRALLERELLPAVVVVLVLITMRSRCQGNKVHQ